MIKNNSTMDTDSKTSVIGSIKEKYPEIFDLIITLVCAVGITEQQRQDAKKEAYEEICFKLKTEIGRICSHFINKSYEKEVSIIAIERDLKYTIDEIIKSKLKEAKK